MIDVLPLAAVEQIVINDGLSAPAQRSMVLNLAIAFNSIVMIDPGAFAVERVGNGGGLVNTSVATSVVGGKTVARLTFSGGLVDFGSLKDGNYRLTIYGNRVHDGLGLDLDGDGNAAAGGNRLFGAGAATARYDRFFRLFGDTDGDRDVDNLDYARFVRSYGKTSLQAGFLWYLNFDNDDDVDFTDLARFRLRYGTSLALL